MSDSPSTVRRSFLFTDIEGSSRLWDEFPDSMLDTIDRHNALLVEIVAAEGGRVVANTGDGVVAVFDAAGPAVDAGIMAQRAIHTTVWNGPDVLRVRMGVHTGSVVERPGDYQGWALNVASRLHSLAHGGQLVVSGPAHSDAQHGTREQVEFLDLGMHRLRDISDPIRVYSVVADGLPGRFDSLRETARPIPAIPQSLTTFVGRAREGEQIEAELRAHRLVTLAGVAGVGKTRLAVEVAGRVAERFADGVAMCELAGVPASQVGAALGKVLGVERRTLRSAEESVVEWLHDKELLLVLDNCEDEPMAVGELALAISQHAPRCRLLATSREPLAVAGEYVTLLQPFDASGETDDGVALFMDRARAVGAHLADDPRTIALVREVCEAVAGVPLAIEIAASNAASLGLLDIVDAVRVGDLPGTGRSGGRHRSVHGALDLTFDRLDPVLREAFLRSSVFAGSFDRDAFAAVAAPSADSATVLAALRGLVDRSLMVSETRMDRTRFRLLEPVRLYAESHLSDEARGELRASFTSHYVSVAEVAADRLRGPDEARFVVQLQLDFENLRAAQHRAIADGNADAALRIVSALWDFAFMRMRSEIFDWGEHAASAAPPDHPLLPLVLGVVALGGWVRESPQKTAMYAEASLRAEQELGVAATLPVRLAVMNSAEYGGAPIDMRRWMGEVLELSRASDSAYWQANADVLRSLGQSFGGRTEPALELSGRALEIARQSGNPSTIAWAMFSRGVATELVDRELAEALLDDALERARSVDNHWIAAMCASRLVSLRRRRGAAVDAITMAEELLDTWERAGHRSHLWSTIEQAALCLGERGDERAAVVLERAAGAAQLRQPQLPEDQADLAMVMSAIEEHVGAEQMQRWAALAVTFDQSEAVRFARERLHAAMAQ